MERDALGGTETHPGGGSLVLVARALSVDLDRGPATGSDFRGTRAAWLVTQAFAELFGFGVVQVFSLPADQGWEVEVDLAPEDCLQKAVGLQKRLRVLPREGFGFQLAIALVTDRSQVEATFRSTRGGNVACSIAAYQALRDAGGSYYDWQPAGDGQIYECQYDTPLAMLEAPFERMFAAEMQGWVLARRGLESVAAGRRQPRSPFSPEAGNDLFGIALSGGGMRSATFSLGVLQALARYNLLESADYLSSVSGGGYVAASIAGLSAEQLPYEGLSRLGCSPETFPFASPGSLLGESRSPDIASAEQTARMLPVHGGETPAQWHVRKYANLLGSGIGLFDATTWLSVGRYLASTLLLWALFLAPAAALGVLLVLPPWMWAWGPHGGSTWHTQLVVGATGLPLVVLALLGAWTLGRPSLAAPASGQDASNRLKLRWIRGLVIASGLWSLIILIGVAAALLEQRDAWWTTATAASSLAGGALAGAGTYTQRAGGRARQVMSRLLVVTGGYLLIGTLLILWAWLAAHLLGTGDSGVLEPREWAAVYALIVLLGLVTTAACLSPQWSRALLNKLSLSGIYESRIRQTWIVSARDPDDPNTPLGRIPRWSRVWSGAGLTLATLRSTAGSPTTPYPLFCATLNIPGSRGDKLAERKGDSFVVAPLFTGSASSRWSPTHSLSEFRQMPIARAAAISGAAVSPNMGEKTTSTLSIITTLLNVRLGYWTENPRGTSRGPVLDWLNRLVPLLYFKELAGKATRDDRSIYLSDGGHFENLGVYELFRRRCRYILAVSADVEDTAGEDRMGNLGTALRMARVDFGVQVDLGPLKPILRDRQTGRVLSHYAVGRIRYPRPRMDPHPNDEAYESARRAVNSGYFVFIKSSLVDETLSPDLVEYVGQNPGFPYDPTSDQQFDQSQFEAYRELGYVAARSLFDKHPLASVRSASLDERFAALSATSGAPGD